MSLVVPPCDKDYVVSSGPALSESRIGIGYHTTSPYLAAFRLSPSDCRGACQDWGICMTSNRVKCIVVQTC